MPTGPPAGSVLTILFNACMAYGVRDLGDGRLIEFCDECGFDGLRARPFDQIVPVIAALRSEQLSRFIDRRPAPETWSASEYLSHCADMVGEALVVIRDGRPAPQVPVDDLFQAEAKIGALIDELRQADLERPIELGGRFPATPRWMLVHVQHDLEHHLLDIRRGYAKLTLETVDPGPW